MKNIKNNENEFKFVGKDNRFYNAKNNLKYYNEMAKDAGVKLVNVYDGAGNKMNAIVRKNAKPDKMGNYSSKDRIGNWMDANMCSTYLMWLSAGVKLRKRK